MICALEQVRGVGGAEVARIARLQANVIHRDQLLAAGIGRGAIVHRLRTGRLVRAYRDVYLVDDERPKPLTLAMAAVIHFRCHAVLSHRIAGALWGLIEGAPEMPEVTLVGRSSHRRPGLIVHRVNALDRRDVRRRHGLPVTSPARTVADLAASEGNLELENALAECLQRGLAPENEIRAALDRVPKHPGVGRLRGLLDRGHPALTRSMAERILLALIRAAELPSPLANVIVCGHKVDLFWPAHGLVVEFDGWDTHRRRSSFETDRRRDQRLVAAGYRVLRITWRQLENERFAVIARLAGALSMA